MRGEIRPFHPAGSSIVELCQVRLAARIAESHLAALQVSVRIGELSPVEGALQAAEAVEYATGTLEVLYA